MRDKNEKCFLDRVNIMAYIYRYCDKLDDNKIKYVGIVWSENRSLEARIREHALYDEWINDGVWKIEYIFFENISRNDLEALEAHLIYKYRTYNYYNIDKKDWGPSSYMDVSEHDWKEWKEGKENATSFQELKMENDELRTYLSETQVQLSEAQKTIKALQKTICQLQTKKIS